MKKIALIHRGTAYKPEALAYQTYFSRLGFGVDILNSWPRPLRRQYDIEWHFTGMDLSEKSENRLVLHEYTCASNPPAAQLKNWVKTRINQQPHARIFGSRKVEEQFPFSDELPVFFRDAGVAPAFFVASPPQLSPTYDLVYCGTMDRVRQIDSFVTAFIRQLPGRKLLMIGSVPPRFARKYQETPGIYFTGRIPYEQVPEYLKQARYGVNFIPPVPPLNTQRPLKLIEYCALGLKIITTDYPYVNQFEEQRQARFFKLKPDFSNLTWEALESFSYRTPEVTDLSWDAEIKRSGIEDFINDNVNSG